MSLKKLEKNKKTWGTKESYFPFRVRVAPLSEKELKLSKKLSPTQRLEWLLMMQKLLIAQFVKKNQSVIKRAPRPRVK